MKAEVFDQVLNAVDEQIVKTLLYFDIFNYPLKSEEIYRFLGGKFVDESFINARLQYLSSQHIVYQYGIFFSLKNNDASVERRIKGNLEAEKYLILARKKAKLISRFPFVRGVLASGSLSKGYMDENSDLDFFIITKPKRLWIARTLLVLYKRLFLFNSHKYFCVNYFVDEDHLEIEEKNLFTATELATVIPLYGPAQYDSLQQENAWLKNFFPNYSQRNTDYVPSLKITFGKKLLEKILNGALGDALEKYFQNITLLRWKRMYEQNYSANDFKVAFKSKTYAAKNHDRNFQRKVMDLYEEKLQFCGLGSNSGFQRSTAQPAGLQNAKS
jgi:hypothetical protein